MHHHADLRVRCSAGLDDDRLGAVVAEPAAGPVKLGEREGEADLGGKLGERLQQVGVRVARDRCARRSQRHRFAPGQRLGLRELEHRDAAEEYALLARLLAVAVSLPDRHWSR